MDNQTFTPPGSMPPVTNPTPGTPFTSQTPPLAQAQKPKSQLPQILSFIAVCLIAAVAIGLYIWTAVQLDESKTNVAGRLAEAKKDGETEQIEKCQEEITFVEQTPHREFTGPEDYGRLSFMYPRNWGVYVAQDASKGGDYKAFLHPVTIPTISETNRFALRVEIIDRPYETVLQSYDSRIKNGDLRTATYQTGSITGTRLDGAFSKDITGSAVVVKINDKTVVLRTDAETFRTDFEALIATIKFN